MCDTTPDVRVYAMTQKIRKEFYIEPEQDKGLRKLSKLLGVSEDDLIERAIGSFVDGKYESDRAVNGEESEKEDEVMARRLAFGWRNRDEMYEVTLAERGKPWPGLPQEIDESEIERRWQKELYKMRDRRFVRLLGDTETKWDRSRIYDE